MSLYSATNIIIISNNCCRLTLSHIVRKGYNQWNFRLQLSFNEWIRYLRTKWTVWFIVYLKRSLNTADLFRCLFSFFLFEFKHIISKLQEYQSSMDVGTPFLIFSRVKRWRINVTSWIVQWSHDNMFNSSAPDVFSWKMSYCWDVGIFLHYVDDI